MSRSAPAAGTNESLDATSTGRASLEGWSDGKVPLLLRGALAVGCGLWAGKRDGSRGWKEGDLHPNACCGRPQGLFRISLYKAGRKLF